MSFLKQMRTVLWFFRNNSAAIKKRFRCTTVEGSVRVRFAPSPTGYVHLGGLRTALYNYLFAKSQNGTAIIRIEDTDQTRVVHGAAERIIQDLKWCGISFDEGPYFQSKRKELYKKYAHLLVDYGEAYYCFCSPTRLELLRKELLKSGELMRYDNKCRQLSKEEVEKNLLKGSSYCIRFKLKDCTTEFNDLIFGHYHCNLFEIEGDPVILKADGFPTYHLANVVDDHDMKISHVLRGSEWLISTIKHLQIFRALRWSPPVYGHLPLLLNSNGKKFSKRQDDIRISYFKNSGIFPNSLINLVTQAGGGFDINHSERDERNFTIEEMIQRFKIEKINKYSCKLQMEKLNESNRREMKRLMESETGTQYLIKEIRKCIESHICTSIPDFKLEVSDEYIRKVLDIAVNRIHKPEDLLSNNFYFMWVKPQNRFVEGKTLTGEKLELLISKLSEVNWDMESMNIFFKEFAKCYDILYKELMGTLRILLTGSTDGPSVAEILFLLGYEESVSRLKMTLC